MYYNYILRNTTEFRGQRLPRYVCGVLLRLSAITPPYWVTRDYSSRLYYTEVSLVYKPLDVSLIPFVFILYGYYSDRLLSTFYRIIVYLAELPLAPRR